MNRQIDKHDQIEKRLQNLKHTQGNACYHNHPSTYVKHSYKTENVDYQKKTDFLNEYDKIKERFFTNY